ncbi:hypothetical protein SARC_02430, partial [Sphaeroforma arctica JP610]
RRPLPFSPKEMYRGVGINVVSMAPITAMQFGAMQFFSDLLKAKYVEPKWANQFPV